MSQPSFTNIDKAAVLLNRLDPKALDKVLEMLGPECSGKLRPVLTAVARRSDLTALSEQVLQEFRELQQDVRAAISDSPILQQQMSSAGAAAQQSSSQMSGGNLDSSHAQSTPESQADSARSDRTEVNSNDPVSIMAQMSPALLGAALRSESTRVIAIVLKQLPTELSGKVLEVFPAEQRQSVFVLLADKTQINPGVVRSVLQKIVHVCQTMNPAAVEQQDRRLKTLVGVLQAVEREERIRLMDTLAEHDPDLATQIDNAMYDYADVLRIEDRSVQKLLGQLEQKVVAIALKSSPEDLRQKVLKNLSERVRAALNEEMELLSAIPASKVEQARREIANVIRAQDKEGTLVWIE